MRWLFWAHLLLGATLSASSVQAPLDGHLRYVEGCDWVFSPGLKVQVLVPTGWVFQDFSRGPSPRQELYVTPRGVPPLSSEHRFSVFGGIHIRRAAGVASGSPGKAPRVTLEIRRKELQALFKKHPRLSRKETFLAGDFEYFRYEYTRTHSQVPGKQLVTTVFNFKIPCCYEIIAELPEENTPEVNEMILKLAHLLQFSPP